MARGPAPHARLDRTKGNPLGPASLVAHHARGRPSTDVDGPRLPSPDHTVKDELQILDRPPKIWRSTWQLHVNAATQILDQ